MSVMMATGQPAVSSAMVGDDRVAVIDIGSNSIRLVVYASQGRYPFPLFNERSNCRLGEGLSDEGLLAADRIDVALQAMARFAVILRNMQVKTIYPVATAAVRRAVNATDFTAPAEAILGQPIVVLSQTEEAQFVARGITLNIPGASGLIADLGGGSLEVVKLHQGVIENSISFDFGHLSEVDATKIDAALASAPWIAATEAKRLYGVGGSFRALGSAYIDQVHYPLAVLHGLTIKREKVDRLLAAYSADEPDLAGVPLGRRKTMPQAALIMRRLVTTTAVEKIVVSGTSIRDGVIAEHELTEDTRADFLTAIAVEIAKTGPRFDGVPAALYRLLHPLLWRDANPERAERLLYLACLLADLCWNEHEDIRGDIGARRVLALPVNCVTHTERIWLATVIFHRYVGIKTNKSGPTELKYVLKETLRDQAVTIGLAIRFALMFSGGITSCIDYLKIDIVDDKLILNVAAEGAALIDNHARRRFEQLAQSAGLESVINS